MDVEAGVLPGKQSLGPLRAEKLPLDEKSQDLSILGMVKTTWR
jgi:hypothetical protein